MATSINTTQIQNIVNTLTPDQKILYPNTNSGYGSRVDGMVDETNELTPISHYGVTKCEAEDYILRESNGIVFRLATVFGTSSRMRLDLLVNEFVNFLKDYEDAKYLQETGESLGEDDERSVADLLVDQIEFADVILISKTDLVESKDIDKLKAIIKNLNTNARILPITMGEVEIDIVLNTGLFDFDKAKEAPGWLKEMRGDHIPETEEYGISSFSYVARRPFLPEKFFNFVHNTEQFGKLIRSKGYFWLGSRLEYAGQWSQAGGIARYGFAGLFWRSVPKKDWPTDEESLKTIKENWVEPFGDMRQELVFIGQGLDQENMIKALDDCLVSEDDMLKGEEFWTSLEDPFPPWEEIQ